MNNISFTSIVHLIGFVLIFIAAFMGLSRVDTFLHNQAVDYCNRMARIETNDGKVKIGYPASNIYSECMQKMNK